MRCTYLDASAITKLIVREVETDRLRAWLVATDLPTASSIVARTEVRRAVARSGAATRAIVDAVLESIVWLMPDTGTFDAAGSIAPPQLRALDAIHVAAAQELGPSMAGFVTYDQRQADAARGAGLDVVAP